LSKFGLETLVDGIEKVLKCRFSELFAKFILNNKNSSIISNIEM
jgi:hypothetical protein